MTRTTTNRSSEREGRMEGGNPTIKWYEHEKSWVCAVGNKPGMGYGCTPVKAYEDWIRNMIARIGRFDLVGGING